MSLTAATIMMTGASLVTLGLLVPALRRARASGDLDASAGLTLGMAWLVCLPIAVVALSGGVVRRPDAFGELATTFPGWYPRATEVARLGLAILAAGLLLTRLRRRSMPVHGGALLAICLWGVAQLAGGLHDEPGLSLGSGVLLICLIATTVLPRGRGACLGAGLFGVTLAIASGALTALRRDVAFVIPCEGACSGLGFTGVMPNENLLGITLAAAIPFAYLGFRGPVRYWFVLYIAVLAISTGSRTAGLAAGLAVVALLVVRPSVDAARAIGVRAAIAGIVLVGAVIVSVYAVRGDWNDTDLTGRPALWSVASDYIDRSPWFGHGPERWAQLYASSEIPRAAQRTAHNQWMDVLFVAGAVGAVLFVGMLVTTISSAGRARPGAMLALATIFMIGATEGAWSVGILDLLSFSLIALLLTGPTERSNAVFHN